jgi:hypothetical protein
MMYLTLNCILNYLFFIERILINFFNLNTYNKYVNIYIYKILLLKYFQSYIVFAL